MNIFGVSTFTLYSAMALDDVRLRKMVLETAQLLCTSLHHDPTLAPPVPPRDYYKPTHPNHPCAIWARANKNNFKWLARYFLAIGNEYNRRFDKMHASAIRFREPILELILTARTFPPPDEFADCTTYKGQPGTVIEHYRDYLQDKWIADVAKGRTPKWTRSAPPVWATRYLQHLEQTNAV